MMNDSEAEKKSRFVDTDNKVGLMSILASAWSKKKKRETKHTITAKRIRCVEFLLSPFNQAMVSLAY